MTGWAAVVYVCGVLAFECIVALLIIAVDATRERARRRVWESAMLLAAKAPELVAEVAEAAEPEAAVPAAVEHVASIDALPHNALVESVLELEEQIEATKTEAIDLIVEARMETVAQLAETVRQEKAKRRHWSTVKRLKGAA